MARNESPRDEVRELQRGARNRAGWRRAAAAFVLLMFSAFLSTARLPAMIAWPLDRLVLESDLVVVGALCDAQDFGISGSGVLKVKEVLWGTNVPQQLALRWERPTDVVAPGCQSARRRQPHPDEDDMVWLLVREGAASARCDSYSDRRRPLTEKTKVIEFLEEMPVFARRSLAERKWWDPYVDLVFRNTSREAVEIPSFARKGSGLVFAPQARLLLTKWLEDRTEVEVLPLRGRIMCKQAGPMITVPARSEYKITFKPSRMYPLEKGMHYALRFDVDGFPPVKNTNRVSVYLPSGKKRGK